jgi:hypothetical protein
MSAHAHTGSEQLRGRGRQASVPPLLAAYRRFFTDRPETSKLLRFLTFGAAAWATVAQWYVAGPVWTLGAIPALVAAHAVSYYNLRRRVPVLSVVIAVVIVVSGVMMRFQLVEAVRGDRTPVAIFLIISSVAAAFDARTRASLYTQLIFASLVMFFAAELAFGNSFAVFLGGYLAIILAFFGAAQAADQKEDASVAGFPSRAGRPVYWASTGVAALVASGVAFLLLPWDTTQAPQAAQAMILPFNGQDASNEPGITPDQARVVMAQGAAGTSINGGRGATGVEAPGMTLPRGEDPGVAGGDGDGAPGAQSDVVAFVRSPVASYWRGDTLDTYVPVDGGSGRWITTFNQQQRLTPTVFSGQADSTDDTRYVQTYFLQQDIGQPLTGYSPVAWALPWDQGDKRGLEAGETYQVVSETPMFTADDLRIDRAGALRHEYGQLPRDSDYLWALTAAVTQGAETDFDRAAAIAAYLHGLEYDTASESPLVSSAALKKFLAGEEPGSAIDFATAAALMSRASGLDSRVVTGYLPGKYNPYSGATTVMERDAHAWAEVYFKDAGWVPFDASSRPELPAPQPASKPPPGGFGYVLEHRVGDSLANAASKTPGGLKAAFSFLMSHWQYAAAALGAMPVAGAVVWWLTRRRKVRVRRTGYAYSLLDGRDRRMVIEAFDAVEQSLAARGFRRRLSNESFSQYAVAVARAGHTGDIGLKPLAELAARAAYSERPLGESAGADASVKARELRDRARRRQWPERQAA